MELDYLVGIGVLVPKSWLKKIDMLAKKLGYSSRAEYVRDLLRKEMRKYNLIDAIDIQKARRLS